MKKNNCQRTFLTRWFFLVTALWPLYAWAHVGSGEAGGFLTGLQHPVSGFDHVLAMMAGR
jgi:urease accessory protein